MDILTARGAGLLAAAGSRAVPERASACSSLADLPRGACAIIDSIGAATLAEDRDLVRRLIEIGFVPGEKVRVIAHGVPGREPVAVRLGGTTFALRRFEAEYVRVVREGAARL